jgi:hypothetical protein
LKYPSLYEHQWQQIGGKLGVTIQANPNGPFRYPKKPLQTLPEGVMILGRRMYTAALWTAINALFAIWRWVTTETFPAASHFMESWSEAFAARAHGVNGKRTVAPIDELSHHTPPPV